MRYVLGAIGVAGAALAVMAWLSVPKPLSAPAAAGEPALPEAKQRLSAAATAEDASSPAPKQQSTTATVVTASSSQTTAEVALSPPAAARAETVTAPALDAQRAALAKSGASYPRLGATTNDATPILQSIAAAAPPGQAASAPQRLR